MKIKYNPVNVSYILQKYSIFERTLYTIKRKTSYNKLISKQYIIL